MPASLTALFHAELRPWHRRVWVLSAPIIVSNVSTPILGMVDTGVVGHLDSPHYLDAVALSAMLFALIFWSFGFLRMGTTGLTAQARGAGRPDEVVAHLLRAMLLALAIGLVLILLQRPIAAAAFAITDPADQIEQAARGYFNARIWGAPATLINYCLAGWFLAQNRTRYILAQQLLLNGSNILLDLLFVVQLDMAADGVGLASAIAEYLALVLGLALAWHVLASQSISLHRSQLLDRASLRQLFSVNRDIMIRTLCLQIAFLWFMSQSENFGPVTMAANAALLQLQTFMAFALDGFAFSAEALTGEAKGAGNRRHFEIAMVVTTMWAALFGAGFSVAYLAGGQQVVNLLTDLADVRAAAATYLPYAVILPLVSVWSFQLDGIFIGTTSGPALRNAMIASLAGFLAIGYGLMPVLGNHGLWLGFCSFMLLRTITLALALPGLRRQIGAADMTTAPSDNR